MTRKGFTLIGIVFVVCLTPLPAGAQGVTNSQGQVEKGNKGQLKTWKTIDELSAEEKAVLDLRTETPRDSQVPYLVVTNFLSR
jgi:hypothetical protein